MIYIFILFSNHFATAQDIMDTTAVDMELFFETRATYREIAKILGKAPTITEFPVISSHGIYFIILFLFSFLFIKIY